MSLEWMEVGPKNHLLLSQETGVIEGPPAINLD